MLVVRMEGDNMELKPVMNYRTIRRRCCASCEYLEVIEFDEPQYDEYQQWQCIRPNGKSGEWDVLEPEFHVCDGHKWNSYHQEMLDENKKLSK